MAQDDLIWSSLGLRSSAVESFTSAYESIAGAAAKCGRHGARGVAAAGSVRLPIKTRAATLSVSFMGSAAAPIGSDSLISIEKAKVDETGFRFQFAQHRAVPFR